MIVRYDASMLCRLAADVVDRADYLLTLVRSTVVDWLAKSAARRPQPIARSGRVSTCFSTGRTK
jgi:hypothetical protein